MAEASRDMENDLTGLGKQSYEQGKRKISAMADNLKSTWQDSYEDMRYQAQQARHASEDFIKEHPLSTVLGAAAVGFLVGKIISKTRH